MVDGERRRRFDIVLYVNGMPLGVHRAEEGQRRQATTWRTRTRSSRTYVDELPLAFRCNVVCVVTDGIGARYGTAFTPFEHFAPWNVDDDGEPVKQPPAPS